MQAREDQPLSVHLSPEIMSCLDDQNFFYYDKEKSDVFVMAMIMVDLALLRDHFLYNTEHHQAKLDVVPRLLEEIEEQYGENFAELLRSMLQVEAKKRPNLT